MDLYDSAVRTLSALVIVLGLMGVATWVFRRFGTPRWLTGGPASPIRVVATTSLGPRKAISLVSVGGELLIVGTGATDVVPLGRVRHPERVLASLGSSAVEGARSVGDRQRFSGDQGLSE